MPLWQSRKTLHKWKDNLVLAKPLPACTNLSSKVSLQLFELQVQKNRRFHVPQPTFLFPLEMETPLRLSRNMLHGWKDNSMLVKPLTKCTHLSSTVSQLFEPQVQKKSQFSRTAAHICVSPGDAPAIIMQYVAWMERQFNACQTPRSWVELSWACTYLYSIVSELYDA